MNYPAMRWVASTDCKVEGPARAMLWAIAYHGDRDTGDCWLGQRSLARKSGFDPKTVERAMPRLFAAGVLELVEQSRGPIPACYRIAPELVEAEASGSGVVEATTTAQVVEGSASGVIHNPEPTADTESAQGWPPTALVPTLEAASADIATPLVPTLRPDSAPSQHALSSENGSQGFEVQDLRSREGQVVRADPTADAVGADAMYTPPEVSEAQREWLRRRGLGQKQRPPVARLAPPPPDQPAPTRTRDEQLAELRRRNAAEFAEQERQEREGGVHVQAHAGVAEGRGVALDGTVAVTAHAHSAAITVDAADAQVRAVGEVHAAGEVHGEQRTTGRTAGQRVELDDQGAAVDRVVVQDRGELAARERLRVVNE
jgi:hypothetical protein